MCDYSLRHLSSRPAQVGETLITRDFDHGTIGFAASIKGTVAACVLPGAELAFAENVKHWGTWFAFCWRTVTEHKTAIFRQVDLDNPDTHHDALEFPDGSIVKLTKLCVGQRATVLQMPAKPIKGSTEANVVPSAGGRVPRLRV